MWVNPQGRNQQLGLDGALKGHRPSPQGLGPPSLTLTSSDWRGEAKGKKLRAASHSYPLTNSHTYIDPGLFYRSDRLWTQ